MSINRVNVTGCLTRDSELKATQGGSVVLRFGVAVNDRRKNPQTGEWEDYPNFVDMVMFGTRAEKVAQYLTKGTKVAVEGKLRYSAWERDGQKRSKLEVVVDEVEFLSARQAQPAPQAPTDPSLVWAQGAINAAFPGSKVLGDKPEYYDSEIPF